MKYGTAAAVFAALIAAAAPAAERPGQVIVAPNFHPACCGWLADFSVERNYCANSYLDHLDRVRDDPAYAFAISEVPNLIAIRNFEPARFDELVARIREGRVEAVNAFFLEPTINLSGGEALVKSGIEGLRWQEKMLGVRPRIAWMIDVTGTHEQMAQIAAGLGLDALAYTRHNPTGSALHWAESPDGTRIAAVSPGHYSEWGGVFAAASPLGRGAIEDLLRDAEARAGRTPPGAPVLVLGGSGDYALAPACRDYPTALIEAWKEIAPGTDLRFATPGKYLDEVLPKLRSGEMAVPTMRGGTAFSFNSFWIQSPTVKSWYRRCEGALAAAETAATIASLRGGFEYPVTDLNRAWLQMLLNMDRNTLWGAAGGMVFESERSWDARDRFRWVEEKSAATSTVALRAILGEGRVRTLFNPLNWDRRDPVFLSGGGPSGTPAQPLEEGERIVVPHLPSCGIGGPAEPLRPLAPRVRGRWEIETEAYVARIDPATGGIASLKLKPSMREVLEGPANVLVAERPEHRDGDPGDATPDRPGRKRVGDSGREGLEISVESGLYATVADVRGKFAGGKEARRRMLFYHDFPRIDCDTWIEDIPDNTVVVAEFPLAGDIVEARRGIPYGFAHGAVARPNGALHGFMKGITPAVRWSDYTLEGGAGVAILDRGLSGREIDGRTPLLFLLNATDTYYGYPNSWLSGKGKRRLSYAILAHDGPWAEARIPRRAFEYNAPPILVSGVAATERRSFLSTSDNVIVEAMRREGPDLEVRLAECLGSAGEAMVKLDLPHLDGRKTDLAGGRAVTLESVKGSCRFPVRPQEIVTLRFRTENPVEEVKPIERWDDLVPPAKLAALNRRILRKGHPPRGGGGDAEDDSGADSKAPRQDLERWKDLRFGMFIHWGPVSLKGTEIGWSRGGERRGTGGTGEIPVEVYDNLYKEFNPTKFDAREWVSIAKAAGMKYLVFTTKHHDGFCEFDSALTGYKVTNSPFKRDIVAELAKACHEGGLAFGIYYSPPDWHHPDYRTASHARYIEYLHGQLRELCTKYGRIDMIFFDGLGGSARDWDAGRLLHEIRRLQPHVIINNRTGLPADNDTPEQRIGGFQTHRAWETCMTIGDQWAWKPDDKIKSLAECLGVLVRCAGGDGNLLFNVGPMPTGEIEARQAERLREMGRWLEANGESIYGTRGGPFRPGPWGASTHRDDKIFVHVLAWPGEELVLPGLTRKVLSSTILGGGSARAAQGEEEIRIHVAPADRKPIDTIVVLGLDGPARTARARGPTPVTEGKPCKASNVYQGMVDAHGPAKALDGDPSTRWATDSGVHAAWLEVDLGKTVTIDRTFVSEAYDRVREFEIRAKRGESWVTIAKGGRIGGGLTVEFPPAEAQVIRLEVLRATDGPTIWEFALMEARR